MYRKKVAVKGTKAQNWLHVSIYYICSKLMIYAYRVGVISIYFNKFCLCSHGGLEGYYLLGYDAV